MEPVSIIDYAEGEVGLWRTFTDMQYEASGLWNLLLLIAMFVIAKFIFRSFIMSEKRGKKPKSDNFAYSISAFSLFISLAVIITASMYGDVTSTTEEGLMKTFTYASIGIALLIVSGFIFDKIALSQFNVNKAIAEGNEAAAIVDAGNFFASALIISALMMWEEFRTTEGVIAILSLYFVSQVILTIATLVRSSIFNNSNKSIKLQDEIEKNNTAVAIDFAGRRIGTAFAISAATNLLAYSYEYDLRDVIIEWTGVSICLVIALNILAWVATKFIFFRQDTYNDILAKKNSSAMGDAAIYISFGLILANTLY